MSLFFSTWLLQRWSLEETSLMTEGTPSSIRLILKMTLITSARSSWTSPQMRFWNTRFCHTPLRLITVSIIDTMFIEKKNSCNHIYNKFSIRWNLSVMVVFWCFAGPIYPVMSAIKTKCKADANYIPTEDDDLDDGQRISRQTKKARKAEKKTPEGPIVKVKNEKYSEELSMASTYTTTSIFFSPIVKY